MLNDLVRMQSYEEANKQIVQDQMVIDVGAGTGVLSMFAAKHGAKKVYAIEYSDIVNKAIKVVNDNNLDNKIVVIQEKAEYLEIPNLKADVIISEWMGYFLLKENMLPSVLHIRDKYLKEDGKILPQNASILISGIYKEQNINGINFSAFGKESFYRVRIEICKEDNIITTQSKIFDFDLKFENMKQSQFETEFEVTVLNDGYINGFVGWFEVYLTDNIKLSTSPFSQETHWKQTIMLLENNVQVFKDEIIKGKIKAAPNNDNYRTLDIYLSYQTQKMKKMKTLKYLMD